MKVATTVVGTGGIVALGKWSEDKKVTMKMVVGLAAMAVGLSVISEVRPKLGEQFGTLVFVTALLLYVDPVSRSLGLIERNRGILGGLGDAVRNVLP